MVWPFILVPLRALKGAGKTLVDILEHTPDPRKLVEKARDWLNPGGILVIVTPDIKSLAARLAGNRWWHFRPGHLGYFQRQSLQKLLELASFQILKWKRYSWSFSLDYLLRRLHHFSWLLKISGLSSLWPRIQIKLALGDSFEVYARKKEKI
jgi:SAM-dependent methyltransferase